MTWINVQYVLTVLLSVLSLDLLSSASFIYPSSFAGSVVSRPLLICLPALYAHSLPLWYFPAFWHFIFSFCLCLSRQENIKKTLWAPACCLRCLSAALQSWSSFLLASGHAARPLFVQLAVGLNRMSKKRQTCCDKPLPVSFVSESNHGTGQGSADEQ